MIMRLGKKGRRRGKGAMAAGPARTGLELGGYVLLGITNLVVGW